jgi:hypothetical protein
MNRLDKSPSIPLFRRGKSLSFHLPLHLSTVPEGEECLTSREIQLLIKLPKDQRLAGLSP